MNTCYWCGEAVLVGEGAREHLVPKTILQDVGGDTGDFIISQKNAHATCNHHFGKMHEHDFCQILFHLAFEDEKAKKHNASKMRNLQRNRRYLSNVYDRMTEKDDRIEILLSDSEKDSFETIIKKILKGLFLKCKGFYLDLEKEYSVTIVWKTINIEYAPEEHELAQRCLSLMGIKEFVGNPVFKYRYRQVEDGESTVWEFLFYERFPVYLFLLHNSEKRF